MVPMSEKMQTMNLLKQGATEVAKQYFLSGVSCPSLGVCFGLGWFSLVMPDFQDHCTVRLDLPGHGTTRATLPCPANSVKRR